MKAHVLVNILNHVPGDAEWDGGDLLTLSTGDKVSISETAKTMFPGESQLLAPVDHEAAGDDNDNDADLAPEPETLPD